MKNENYKTQAILLSHGMSNVAKATFFTFAYQFFPENLGIVSDGQEQDSITTLEPWRTDIKTIGTDYCWFVKKNTLDNDKYTYTIVFWVHMLFF